MGHEAWALPGALERRQGRGRSAFLSWLPALQRLWLWLRQQGRQSRGSTQRRSSDSRATAPVPCAAAGYGTRQLYFCTFITEQKRLEKRRNPIATASSLVSNRSIWWGLYPPLLLFLYLFTFETLLNSAEFPHPILLPRKEANGGIFTTVYNIALGELQRTEKQLYLVAGVFFANYIYICF